MCLPAVLSHPDRVFITKTYENVKASRVFMFGTDQNARASEKKSFEIVVLQCFPDISVAKT